LRETLLDDGDNFFNFRLACAPPDVEGYVMGRFDGEWAAIGQKEQPETKETLQGAKSFRRAVC
jgi:hypothetical protein